MMSTHYTKVRGAPHPLPFVALAGRPGPRRPMGGTPAAAGSFFWERKA